MSQARIDVADAAAIGQRMVFVCGLHRSGTSVVHRCLREHPEVSGFSDTGVPRSHPSARDMKCFLNARRASECGDVIAASAKALSTTCPPLST